MKEPASRAAAGPAAGERVIVAMSGGVDSSLAAALMAARGCEVVGITMYLSGSTSRCCSAADAEDARATADKLGIRFFVANYSERFRSEVMEDFADSYLAGRTPIPCVVCNSRFKFDHLLERTRVFDSQWVATGHYARVDRDPASGRLRLRRAADRGRDQTYFLFQLDQAQLSRACFPLGEMTKKEVRARARALGLPAADKPKSQELCFVKEGHYVEAVEAIRPHAKDLGGEIVDEEGRVLGRHSGVHRFTVGQRHGLGLAVGRPLYVSRIEADKRRIVVGGVESLACRGAGVEEVHWIAGEAPRQVLRAEVQVRHRHCPVSASVEPEAPGRARVIFDEAVCAVTPGQAAVFYQGDIVLGGGWIERALRGTEGRCGQGEGQS